MEAETRLTPPTPGAPPAAGGAAPPNPFVGPRSFAKGETLFGRDREAQEIVDLLIAERIVLLYSPSGAGKTSLLQAKLIPMFEQEGFAVRPVVRVGQPPSAADVAAGFANRYLFSTIRALEAGMTGAAPPAPRVVAASTLGDFLATTAPRRSRGEAELLIFDQFEEILTVDRNAIAAKEAFFDQVGEALHDKTRWALFSMREDFVPALDPYLRRIPRRLATRFRLDLLGVDAARRAILGPAEADGIRLAPQVVADLVDDLRKVRVQDADGATVEQLGPVVEPVQLQVVCYRAWDALARTAGGDADGDGGGGDDRAMRNDLAVGDVDEALGGYYAEKVAAVAAELRVPERTIREWCEAQLITAHGFRGQVLREVPATQGLDNGAILGLIDAHLVRSDDHHGATWFELAHDRLIDPVRADNAAWRREHLDPIQMFAADWARAGSPPNLLPAGAELKAALAWGRARPPESLSRAEASFFDALASKAGAEKSRRERRLLAAGVLILFVMATFLAITLRKEQALQAANRAAMAAEAATRAETDRAEAEKDKAEAEKDKAELAVLLKDRAELAARKEAELRRDAYEELEERANQRAQRAADVAQDPLAHPVRFPGGTIVFRYTDDAIVLKPPVRVRYNGEPVVKTRFPPLDLFNTVDIFEKVDDRHPALLWSDRISNLHLRATYTKAEPPDASMGTVIIATPTLVPEIKAAAVIPEVETVELERSGSTPLRSTTHASFGAQARVTSTRTFHRPVVGRTVTDLAIDFENQEEIRIAQQDGARVNALRLMSVASMFSDESHYNADLLRFEDEAGRVHELSLRDVTPRGRNLFLDERGQPRAQGLGRWFELVKRPGSHWFPDGPSIRVEIAATANDQPCRLGFVGWLAETRTPGNESLQCWVRWRDIPPTLPVGTKIHVAARIMADAPGRDDREESFAGGVVRLLDAPLVAAPVVPVALDGKPVGAPKVSGADLFNTVQIRDRAGDGPGVPLTWSAELATLRLRPTYQRPGSATGAPEVPLGTAILAAAGFQTAGGRYGSAAVDRVDLARVAGPDRLRAEFAARLGSLATGRAAFTFPDPTPDGTRTGLALAFEAREAIHLDPQRLGSDAFRLASLVSMYAGAGEYDADALRYRDDHGTEQTVRIADRLRANGGKRGFYLFEDEAHRPRAVPVSGPFELIKGPGSSHAPTGPSVGLDVRDRHGFAGKLGLQGWLDPATGTDADSLVVWLEWLDAPKVVPAGTRIELDCGLTARRLDDPPAPR